MKPLPRYFRIVALMAVFYGLLALGMAAAAVYGLHTGASLALVLPGGLVALAALAACLWSVRVARRALHEADIRARSPTYNAHRRDPA